MSKKNRIRTDNLSRFLVYVLGHRPDEFGLVPEEGGFVTYKELLWALHEEPGWRYVRQTDINEVLVGKDRALFQTEDNTVRVLKRRWDLDVENPSPTLSKILYIAVRRKAHPVVMEKGLIPPAGRNLLLSPDREMALRVGRRRDPSPVLLEVMAAAAQNEGIAFYTFGHSYLSRKEIPARFISGPPVSTVEVKPPREEKGKREEKAPDFDAGVFVLDPDRDPDTFRRTKGKKKKSWKEEARKKRRKKGIS